MRIPTCFPPNPAASDQWVEDQARAARPAPLVPPERDSTRGWPDGMEIPGGAKRIGRAARAAGWVVEYTYSRGTWPGARVSKVVHCAAVRMLHRETGLRAAALYRVEATGPAIEQSPRGWEAGGCLVKLPGGTLTPYCSLGELVEVIGDPGRATLEWAERLSRQVREQAAEAKRKARDARKTGTRKGSEDHD